MCKVNIYFWSSDQKYKLGNIALQEFSNVAWLGPSINVPRQSRWCKCEGGFNIFFWFALVVRIVRATVD